MRTILPCSRSTSGTHQRAHGDMRRQKDGGVWGGREQPLDREQIEISEHVVEI